tara:strand:+ start:96 stop:569 length:474 start_codon:yes stop_codon:yes gene_type:complete
MMESTEFNKQVCKDLGVKVEAAVKEALKDSGFDVALGSGSYSDAEFGMKLKFTFTDGETQAHIDYREFAKLPYTHFPPDMLDATFDYGQFGKITVIGWKPNRPKMDILFVNKRGVEKLAPSDQVIRCYENAFGKYIKPDMETESPVEMEVTYGKALK